MVLVAVFLEDPSQWVAVEVGESPVRIGRQPEVDPSKEETVLQIPWRDRLVNRDHSIAQRKGDVLTLRRMPAKPNRGEPNRFYTNVPHAERTPLEDPVRLKPGQSFSIGKQGRTAFFWLRSEEDLARILAKQRPFGGLPGANAHLTDRSGQKQVTASLNYEEVEALDDYSLRLQLKLLQRELPDKVLSGWTTGEELFTKAADFLKTALPGQRGVSVAFLALEDGEEGRSYEIINEDPAARADFRVSNTLIGKIDLEAASAHDAFVWSSREPRPPASVTDSSILDRVDWVAILPVAPMQAGAEIYRGPKGRLVYLYVEVRQSSTASAQAFVPFLRLISSLVASLLAAREQQRIQDQLSAYFSPALRQVLHQGELGNLQPMLAECTVLFCDRRSSSRIMEAASNDEEILSQLRENQAIVSQISATVFEHDGVITDFAGDGVLALWGWPVADPDHALHAANAAQSIAERLASRTTVEDGHRICAVRMGISTGRIAVGNTGPVQQMHISVFGKVVNFGARLEGLGKQFRVPCLLSEDTCQLMRNSGKLLRRLCYLRPAGFEGAYPIYELVLPVAAGGSGASPQQIAAYEEALEAFIGRDWDGCQRRLKDLPPEDVPAHWLFRQAEYHRKRDPGPDWQGEIASLEK